MLFMALNLYSMCKTLCVAKHISNRSLSTEARTNEVLRHGFDVSVVIAPT
jgi:hypothetical protein